MCPGLQDRIVEHGAAEIEAQQDFAILALLDHFGIERGKETGHPLGRGAEPHALADAQFLGRAHEGTPAIGGLALVQRRFDPRDRLAADANARKPRRDHPRIVDDEHIAGTQVIRQIADAAILEGRGGRRRHDEQAGAVARLGRPQRDAILGQIEIEEIDAHRLSCSRGRRPRLQSATLSLWQRVFAPASVNWCTCSRTAPYVSSAVPKRSCRDPSPARRA